MSIEQCTNNDCRHLFELIEFGSKRPAPLVNRSVCCPYCGHSVERPTRGAFITAPCEQQQYDAHQATASRPTSKLPLSG